MESIKFLHKWLSIIVTLQLIIWLGSGLFFNLMDHTKARGNEYRINAEQSAYIDHTRLLEPRELVKKEPQPIHSIKLVSLLGQPYYLLNHSKGLYEHFYNKHSLVNAYTGNVKIIDETMATALASSSYSGEAEIRSSVKVAPFETDFPRERNKLWQVDFADELNTSVYIDASSGRLVGHSNDDKRFADFFFMLHFMDYGSVGGFNNWQIIFFALLTLLFCITGFIWTVNLLVKGRYKLS